MSAIERKFFPVQVNLDSYEHGSVAQFAVRSGVMYDVALKALIRAGLNALQADKKEVAA